MALATTHAPLDLVLISMALVQRVLGYRVVLGKGVVDLLLLYRTLCVDNGAGCARDAQQPRGAGGKAPGGRGRLQPERHGLVLLGGDWCTGRRLSYGGGLGRRLGLRLGDWCGWRCCGGRQRLQANTLADSCQLIVVDGPSHLGRSVSTHSP